MLQILELIESLEHFYVPVVGNNAMVEYLKISEILERYMKVMLVSPEIWIFQ